MKKQIIIAAIVLLIAASAGIFFYACQKDEAVKTTSSTYCATCEAENAEKVLPDIDELIAQTGIDIYALSEKEYIDNVVKKDLLPMMCNMQNTSMDMKPNKSSIDDAVLEEMETLLTKMEIAEKSKAYNDFYALSEKLFALINANGGFHAMSGRFVMENHTYNGVTYQIPVDFIEQQYNQLVEVVSKISTDIPVFTTLTPVVQSQVIASTYSVNLSRTTAISLAKSKQQTCLQAYKEDEIVAIVGFELSMAGCVLASGAATPVAGGICVLVATGKLVYSLKKAEKEYERCCAKYES